MQKILPFRPFGACALGLVMTGLLLVAPIAVDAAQQIVRLNIPGCMS